MTTGRSVRQRLRHDVRSPLAVIMGRCEMLLQETHGPMTAPQVNALEAVLRNARRLEGELQALADGLPDATLDLRIPDPGTAG